MKPTTILVSALATLVAAAPAPADKAVEKRSFNFNAGSFNNFGGFNAVNFGYLGRLNNVNLDILQLLASNNNFNINGFAGLFALQGNQIDIQNLLLMQQLLDLQFFAQAGVLNSFDLSGFNFGGIGGIGGILDTGLLNFGGIDLNQFIVPQVVTQVQTVASSFLVAKE